MFRCSKEAAGTAVVESIEAELDGFESSWPFDENRLGVGRGGPPD